MGLKVLCAGCAPEDKERAESDVRRALGARVQAGAWLVSLVKLQDHWAVTIDGPEARGLSCRAPDSRLTESIVETLRSTSAAPAVPPTAAPPPAAPPVTAPRASPAAPSAPASATAASPASGTSRRDRYRCPGCKQVFMVVYDGAAEEPKATAPVACPHCWKVNRIKMSQSAVETKEYRAEKVLA